MESAFGGWLFDYQARCLSYFEIGLVWFVFIDRKQWAVGRSVFEKIAYGGFLIIDYKGWMRGLRKTERPTHTI